MDTRIFEDVLVLLEERNMSRAAARRNITQPAFSRRIRSFEIWLGVDILDRKTNRIDISSALLANEAEIRAMMARLRELRTKIAYYKPSGATVEIAAQHAPVSPTFSDMVLRAQAVFPDLRFRLRAGNLKDCVTLFVRGDTSLLLCYEALSGERLKFDSSVRRGLWGKDYLIPVVGGVLRYSVKDNRDIPQNTPAIVYPDNSYFGEVLNEAERQFGTANFSANQICQTAFSSGMREMILKGLGVGWLPFSMVHKEIESGALISLAQSLGQEALDVAIYANTDIEIAESLIEFWTTKTPTKSDFVIK
jgi:DNA-binding transcriptional LysR family regulator